MTEDKILIEEALKIIHTTIDSEVSKQHFQEIYVEDVKVHFKNRICYVPLFSTYYYNVSVNLANGDTYAGFETNPEDYDIGKKIHFFAYTENERAIIKNTIEYLNTHYHTAYQDFLGHHGQISIYEEEHQYRVRLFTNRKTHIFYINKNEL